MSDRILNDARDVTDDVLRAAEDVFDGWYGDSPRIDWDAFIDRLVERSDFDVENMASPAVRKIQRHISDYRRSG